MPKPLTSGERFQIPDAELISEGKTTVLRNFIDITTAINREPNQVLQYLLRELGTAGSLEERRVVFKGKVYEVMIQDVGKKGDGIAKKDKYVIYVPGTAKGQIVKVFIEKIAGTVAFGHIHRE